MAEIYKFKVREGDNELEKHEKEQEEKDGEKRQRLLKQGVVTECELIKLFLQPVNSVNEVKSQLEDFSFMENAFKNVQVSTFQKRGRKTTKSKNAKRENWLEEVKAAKEAERLKWRSLR